jgi:Rrf2 family iron-sulfur cluster assembly transcriptional regulator
MDDIRHLLGGHFDNKILIIFTLLHILKEHSMQITHQADYGIRAVRYISRQGADQYVATSTVAREMKIPLPFLAKIVGQLSVAGLLRTSRGAHGGVSLGRESKDISMLDVVEAIDGPIMLNECVGKVNRCAVKNDCPVHPIWQELQDNLITRLGATRFDVSLN